MPNSSIKIYIDAVLSVKKFIEESKLSKTDNSTKTSIVSSNISNIAIDEFLII